MFYILNLISCSSFCQVNVGAYLCSLSEINSPRFWSFVRYVTDSLFNIGSNEEESCAGQRPSMSMEEEEYAEYR